MKTGDRRLDWLHGVLGLKVPPSTKTVAAALSCYWNRQSLDNAHPGPERLADDTNLHVRTVKNGLAMLVAAGWLRRKYRAGPAPMRPSVYVAQWPGDHPRSGEGGEKPRGPTTTQTLGDNRRSSKHRPPKCPKCKSSKQVEEGKPKGRWVCRAEHPPYGTGLSFSDRARALGAPGPET